MSGLHSLLVLAALALVFNQVSATKEAEEATHRDPKFLSVFQIVTFPNDPCGGTSGRNGTCYTAEECSSRSGTSEGSCAQGFGVCCIFSRNCGQTSNENCTFFDSAGTETGQCQLTICPCNTNVCQLRLDFNTFVITGPSTSTMTDAKILNGVPGAAGGGVAASTAGQCLTDTFQVSSPSGCAPPAICGTNTGEHMYVDADQACNDLTFALGAAAISVGSLATRQWSIKVTQLDCAHPNLAPDGCTQYFFDTTNTGTFRTFNFNGGQHLANQDQNFCFRRERGNCRICFTTTNAMGPTDFQLSGLTTSMGQSTTKLCCGYGAAGVSTMAGDCLVLPGAINKLMTNIKNSRFCGRGGLKTKTIAAGTIDQTACSHRMPFSIRFLSDEFEMIGAAISEAKAGDNGVQLTYFQDAINCPVPA